MLSEIVQYFLRSSGVKSEQVEINLEYLYAPKSIVYSNKLGYNEWEHDYRLHKKNLEFCIKKSGKPDLIHAQVTYTGGYCAYRLHKEFDIPFIITERYAPFPHPSFSVNGKLIDKVSLPLNAARNVISVSPAFANIISEISGRNVSAIPNFLDEEVFKPSINAVVNEEFTFATLAVTYEPRKGIDILFKAIKVLKDKGVKARFKVGGGREDNFYHDLKRLENELNVSDYIEWFPKLDRSEVVNLMQTCDCFVMPSLSESFGTVYIEAIACGKPIIATKCGGPESIVDEQVGLIVNINDVDELANAILAMISNKKDYSKEVIRKYFLDNFSKRVVTRKYVDLYNNCI